MYCKNCGDFIKENENFCQTCERPVNRIIPFREKNRKNHKGLVFLVVLLVTFIVAFGILLNMTNIFGAVDLGVSPSEKAYRNAMTKFQSSIRKLDGYTDIVLTNEEITSLIKYNWPENLVAKDLQVKVNENGTVEAAGKVSKYYIANYILGENRNDELKKILPMFDIMPEYPDVYGKFRFEIKNNKVNYISISEIEVMGFEIPKSMYDNANAKNQMADGINQFIESLCKKTGTSFDVVKANNGRLVVKGLLPEIVERKTLASIFEEFSYKVR